MKTVCEPNQCNGCMACIDICPKHCISVLDSVGTYNAIIDKSACINCKACEHVCPSIHKTEKKAPIEWYQGWGKKAIRESSASGGAALSIMDSFVRNGGFVASCIYKQGRFSFEITNNLNLIKKFAGSKYVKSNPTGIYKKIAERLKTNEVLFVGLPCQVAALKNYLGNSKRLFTIDLICHGTPSPELLEIYLNENRLSLKKCDDIKFRTGLDWGLVINNRKITPPKVIDEYMCAFLGSISYTENCYNCRYASIDRVADITLGDSWGSELKEEVKNGISLILVQSEKGMALINKADLELKKVNIDNAIAHNHQLSHPSIYPKSRYRFLKNINNGKSFRWTTFLTLPKMMVRQRIKGLLMRLRILR